MAGKYTREWKYSFIFLDIALNGDEMLDTQALNALLSGKQPQ
jgi:hypothetical protein